MAKWIASLRIRDEWKRAEDGEATMQHLASVIAAQMRRLPEELRDLSYEDIAEQFESLSEDHTATVEEFDSVMTELYDWADSARVWVATI